MAVPRLYSFREIAVVLNSFGFYEVGSTPRSHVKFWNTDERSVLVPRRNRELPVGTFRSELRIAGLICKQFDERAGEVL